MLPTQFCIQQMEELPVIWVTNNNRLNELVEELTSCHTVALDTEFIKRNTYYPILALIQINTGKAIYLVDVPKLQLDELWQTLANLPVMIWHSCSEDLSIFYLLSDVPPLNNIFDSQIALAYLTAKLQIGYQQALVDTLDIHLEKAHSQSDWLVRPLSPEQEHYAVDDVRYLLPLYYQLKQQLNEKGLYDFVWEDCQTLADEIYQAGQIEDEEQYLSTVNSRHNGIQRYFLQDLLTWRERLARATNQPRTFILRKQGIKELVERMPNSIKRLHQQTSIHRTIINTYGNEILKIVRRAKSADPSDYPPAVPSGYRSKDKTLQKAINQCIEQYSDELGVPSNLIIKKKWQIKLMKAVALYDKDKQNIELPKGLQGWRKRWVSQTLIPLLEENRLQLQAGMGLTDLTTVN